MIRRAYQLMHSISTIVDGKICLYINYQRDALIIIYS